MKIREVVKLLGAEVITGGEKLDSEVRAACGSDMMSDVLAYVKDQGMLLTGLVNPQAVRTAQMMDMCCVCFIRGKRPDREIIRIAENAGMVLLASKYRMFEACGILYSGGLGAGGTVG